MIIIELMGNTSKKLISEIFYSSLKSVDPYESVKKHVNDINTVYQDGKFNRLIVVSFGKAACPMTSAMENFFSEIIYMGVAITKYEHCIPRLNTDKIRVYEAGHPLPDENGLRGTGDIIGLLRNADKKTLVVCLISGGGSTLLVSPHEGISLGEKQEITELLLKAGADINELNTVRKHISRIKGGRLAEIAYPAKVISLILSDVIGDRLDVIASGPTSPDKTTFSDALRVLEKYMLMDKSPKSIIEILQNGEKGLVPETPKGKDEVFSKVENIIIGSNRSAINSAKQKAEEMGLKANVISSELTGEAGDIGKWLAQKAKEIKSSGGSTHPICLISGGETTVTVTGNGLGGRNTELALSFAIEVEGIDAVTLLSAGTDGTDGPTDAAGAIVDGETVSKARKTGIIPEEYLSDNDSYNFFKKAGGLFITGPTRTNVMDIQVILIG